MGRNRLSGQYGRVETGADITWDLSSPESEMKEALESRRPWFPSLQPALAKDWTWVGIGRVMPTQKCSNCVRGTTDWNCPPQPGTIVSTCTSYLTTGGPGNKWGIDKLPPTGRIWERPKGERRHQSICPPRILLAGSHFGWAMHVPPGRTLSQSDWPETTQKLTPLP